MLLVSGGLVLAKRTWGTLLWVVSGVLVLSERTWGTWLWVGRLLGTAELELGVGSDGLLSAVKVKAVAIVVLGARGRPVLRGTVA